MNNVCVVNNSIINSLKEMREFRINRKVEDYLKKREISRALKGLSKREIEIINCYYGINGEPMTLEMIGEEVELTKERVRQIKESAIRKIRNNLGGIFNI